MHTNKYKKHTIVQDKTDPNVSMYDVLMFMNSKYACKCGHALSFHIYLLYNLSIHGYDVFTSSRQCRADFILITVM